MAISTVTFKAAGRTHKLRLTTRAGCQIEETFDGSITELLGGAQENFGYRFLRGVYQACLEDGAGVSVEEAETVIDDLGGLKPAADKLNDMIAKAFPDVADDGDDTGNGKGKAA